MLDKKVQGIMKNIGECMEAFKDMSSVLDGITDGKYYTVALDLHFPDEHIERVYIVDFQNAYYKINYDTFIKRSKELQKEFNHYMIFWDEFCAKC